MSFVNEQNDRFGRGLNFVNHTAQALLEFAFHARASLEQADVERTDAHLFERRGNVTGQDAMHKAFDDRGLADAGFAREDRIVLPAAHEDIDALTDFLVPSDDRIDIAFAGLFGEIDGEAFESFLLTHFGGRQSAAGFAGSGAGTQIRVN